jgi:hypothetical protein
LFNGSAPFSGDVPLPSSCFSTDTCLLGGGGFFNRDCFFVDWVRDVSEYQNINVLELKTVLIAVECWGLLWHGKHILVRSDNVSMVADINKGTS